MYPGSVDVEQNIRFTAMRVAVVTCNSKEDFQRNEMLQVYFLNYYNLIIFSVLGRIFLQKSAGFLLTPQHQI